MVVKVSSVAVHSILINPMFSFLALEKIKTAEKLAKEIGSVLYGAVGKEAGMVTIMADLSKQGYGILKPKQHRDKLPLLWAAFEELVKKVLLPMAEIKIVHPDIRPGFDVTSNVLFRLDNEGKKASIKLIDFESVVFLRNWRAPLVDGRYIDKRADWDANTFVWWQCVCLAHTWRVGRKLSCSRSSIAEVGARFLRTAEDILVEGTWIRSN